MRSASVLALLAVACAPGLSELPAGDRRHLHGTLRASHQGTAKVKFSIEEGETAFLATAQVPRPWATHFRTIRDPSRDEVFQAFEWNAADHNLTNGGFVASTATLNWPVLQSDAPLLAGTWEFELGVVDADQHYTQQDVTLDVLIKRDTDFASGRLLVTVVYTGGADEDQELRQAVGAAKDLWHDLYGTVGIDVEFDKDVRYPVDEVGPPALGDESAYSHISEQTGVPHVNLVISPEIVGFEDIFGIAGDIPGPLVATNRSGVQISALLASGPDGHFSDEDTRLLSETMAHESMHFLGLFHPVESTWDTWDSVDDTPECTDEGSCVGDLGANLMFPYPVCSVASCIPQDEITPLQAAVAQRYTGVD